MPEDSRTNEPLSTTRMYRYVKNRKDLNPGGRGKKSVVTTVVRVPLNICQDFDDLLLKYEAKIYRSPSSPRNENLRKLLNELYDLMP